VKDLALDVLRHRVVLTYKALAEDVTSEEIIAAVVEKVPAPKIELARDSA
jgi:MoxR-like ATPase